jgi:hypothetical protein
VKDDHRDHRRVAPKVKDDHRDDRRVAPKVKGDHRDHHRVALKAADRKVSSDTRCRLTQMATAN